MGRCGSIKVTSRVENHEVSRLFVMVQVSQFAGNDCVVAFVGLRAKAMILDELMEGERFILVTNSSPVDQLATQEARSSVLQRDGWDATGEKCDRSPDKSPDTRWPGGCLQVGLCPYRRVVSRPGLEPGTR